MNNRNKYDVVISGCGPSALATAYQAAKNNMSVLIISDRDLNFLRMQKVTLGSEVRNYLQNMISSQNEIKEDILILNKFKHSLGIKIKDIERFLMQRLNELKKSSNAIIDIVIYSQIESVNLMESELIYNSKNLTTNKNIENTINFTYLIGADGPNSHAAYKINERNKQTINYLKDKRTIHQYHISANLIISKKDKSKLHLLDEVFFFRVYKDHIFGLTCSRSNKTLDTNQMKVSFVGELPVTIYNIKDETQRRLMALDYIRKRIKETLLEDELEINIVPSSKKYGKSKDQLKFLFFEVNIKEAEKAFLEGKNQTCFLLVGDAYRSSYYMLGHGMNDALIHTKNLGDVFAQKITILDYNHLCRERAFEAKTSFFFHDKNFYLLSIEQEANKASMALRGVKPT